jgi:hypothetical protein
VKRPRLLAMWSGGARRIEPPGTVTGVRGHPREPQAGRVVRSRAKVGGRKKNWAPPVFNGPRMRYTLINPAGCPRTRTHSEEGSMAKAKKKVAKKPAKKVAKKTAKKKVAKKPAKKAKK